MYALQHDQPTFDYLSIHSQGKTQDYKLNKQMLVHCPGPFHTEQNHYINQVSYTIALNLSEQGFQPLWERSLYATLGPIHCVKQGVTVPQPPRSNARTEIIKLPTPSHGMQQNSH
jgi:hypothetical protein